jgi:uridine kinase
LIGDKLIIKQHHTDRALDILALIIKRNPTKFTISISGESGAGKSELASEIARLLSERGIKTGILQQDDYFVFPPQTNHQMRSRNIQQVSTFEVKLDFLDSNLRSFKKNENPIYKPLVIFDEDRITTEEINTEELAVLIAEGTYTTLLRFIDLRIFIDLDYFHTREARELRARDKFEPFIKQVLEKEHRIISQHKALADVVVTGNYKSIDLIT